MATLYEIDAEIMACIDMETGEIIDAGKLEELEMECQEKINEDMAYALSYLSIFNHQLDVAKMHREMNNLMIIYGLSDMIYRGMTLVKFYAPNGVVLSEILHSWLFRKIIKIYRDVPQCWIA